MHDIPSSQWSSLTLDNFDYKGTLYLIIYDRFSCFIIVKTPRDLSARSAIMCLLEVFCEHGVPSFIRTDRGRNFVSKDFHEFCHDLGIHLNFSSGYHYSANQAERAVCTVKDLMKCCYSASVHWRLRAASISGDNSVLYLSTYVHPVPVGNCLQSYFSDNLEESCLC